MNEQTLVSILAVLVIISALALVIQMAYWIAIYGVVRRVQKSAGTVILKLNELTRFVNETVVENKKQLSEITARSKDIVNSTRTQLARLDDFYADVRLRAANQRERVEMIYDDTVRRMSEPVRLVTRGLVAPARQVHGVFIGIWSAITTIRHRSNQPRPQEVDGAH